MDAVFRAELDDSATSLGPRRWGESHESNAQYEVSYPAPSSIRIGRRSGALRLHRGWSHCPTIAVAADLQGDAALPPPASSLRFSSSIEHPSRGSESKNLQIFALAFGRAIL